MKLSKQELKQIIKEELANEGMLDRLRAFAGRPKQAPAPGAHASPGAPASQAPSSSPQVKLHQSWPADEMIKKQVVVLIDAMKKNPKAYVTALDDVGDGIPEPESWLREVQMLAARVKQDPIAKLALRILTRLSGGAPQSDKTWGTKLR